MAKDVIIGTRLRLLRKNHTKLTQNELGEILGVKGNVVGRIESGTVGIDTEKLQILNIKFKANLNWLVSGIGSPIIEEGSTTTNYADDMQQVNFLGDNNDNIQIAKEEISNYGNKEAATLKKEISHLTTERDLYKKLYEKSEIEIDFYKKQLKK